MVSLSIVAWRGSFTGSTILVKEQICGNNMDPSLAQPNGMSTERMIGLTAGEVRSLIHGYQWAWAWARRLRLPFNEITNVLKGALALFLPCGTSFVEQRGHLDGAVSLAPD